MCEVANEMGWDCLLLSEWQRLEHVQLLLKPIADHTKLLKGDAIALSSVVPSVLDLQCHLMQVIDNFFMHA